MLWQIESLRDRRGLLPPRSYDQRHMLSGSGALIRCHSLHAWLSVKKHVPACMYHRGDIHLWGWSRVHISSLRISSIKMVRLRRPKSINVARLKFRQKFLQPVLRSEARDLKASATIQEAISSFGVGGNKLHIDTCVRTTWSNSLITSWPVASLRCKK
jgi:hypothetical protein